MNKWVSFAIFFAVAVIGAILAFAIDDGHLRAKPLGLVLLAAGGVLVFGWAIDRWCGSPRSTNRPSGGGTKTSAGAFDNVKTIGGLITAVVAILAIVALSLVIVLVVSGFDADKAIAFAASAFGVISAITGAYLGIKITSDQATGTQQAAGLAQAQAAVAQAPEGPAKEQAQTDLAQAAAAQAQRIAGA